jgi:hypothetical protein
LLIPVHSRDGHGLPVVTQDNDYEVLADLGGPAVIRV